MNCPKCDSQSKVTNSRHQKRSNGVWRRRECKKCQFIWTTEERIQSTTVFSVDRDGQILEFASETLMMSLYEALRHKNTALSDAKHLSNTVITKLLQLNTEIVSTKTIKDTVQGVLKNYDKLAADLYKATHKY